MLFHFMEGFEWATKSLNFSPFSWTKSCRGVCWFCVSALSSYLSTSLTVAFSRGMRDTSAAVGTLWSPPRTPSTSARSEACTSGWRDSSYSDQDMVLEIWEKTSQSINLTDLAVPSKERWGNKGSFLPCRLRQEAARWRCCRRSSWGGQFGTGSRSGSDPAPSLPERSSPPRLSFAGQCDPSLKARRS